MSVLVCFLEEESAAQMLRSVLGCILPAHYTVRFIVFEGKQDLEKKLRLRLQFWREPDSCFLIMRDQDSGDCRIIKEKLAAIVAQSGKKARVLIRIACRELESFYLGDLAAVEKGLGMNALAKLQTKAKYRNPDIINNAAEELKRLTGCRYQKIGGSRAIAPYLRTDGSSRSASFNTLVSGIKHLITETAL